MSNSPLIDGTLLSPNNSGTRTKSITKITPHHAAGVLNAKSLAGCFMGDREASANYCIGNEGGLILGLDESKRAWTSSSAANDQQAVTVEISNCATGGDWPVGAKAYAKFIDLCVDVCKRNPGIKQKNGKPGLYYDGTPNGSLTHHSMFAATSCPGPYLLARMSQICEEVNKRLNGQPDTPEPPSGTIYRVQCGAFSKKENADSLEAKLKAAGYETYMVTDGGLYKVQTGAFGKKENADKLQSELKNKGFDTFITTKAGAPAGGGTTTASVEEGDTVRLKKGAKTYTGGDLAGFVYERDHIVSQLDGNRAVITYDGIVIAAVHKKDLIVK